MADLVTSQTLFSQTVKRGADGRYHGRFVFTNVSDGSGESAVAKIDISTLQGAPTAIRIERVRFNINGIIVKIGFDHTTDQFVLVLSGDGDLDFSLGGGIPDPGGAGDTGDVIFTTVGHSSGDSYNIVMDISWP